MKIELLEELEKELRIISTLKAAQARVSFALQAEMGFTIRQSEMRVAQIRELITTERDLDYR